MIQLFSKVNAAFFLLTLLFNSLESIALTRNQTDALPVTSHSLCNSTFAIEILDACDIVKNMVLSELRSMRLLKDVKEDCLVGRRVENASLVNSGNRSARQGQQVDDAEIDEVVERMIEYKNESDQNEKNSSKLRTTHTKRAGVAGEVQQTQDKKEVHLSEMEQYVNNNTSIQGSQNTTSFEQQKFVDNSSEEKTLLETHGSVVRQSNEPLNRSNGVKTLSESSEELDNFDHRSLLKQE